MYNSIRGELRKNVSFVHKYVYPPEKKWTWGTVGGLPAVISTECTGKGVVKSPEGGLCYALRAKGGSNPRKTLKTWYDKLNRCLERRTRDKLNDSDLDDAERFANNNTFRLNEETGELLREESKAQAQFGRSMAKLAKQMPKSTYKLRNSDSSPSTRSFFETAADVFEKNPSLNNHLVKHLLKALVYEEVYGRKVPEIEPKVMCFYRFLKATNPKACQSVAANLGGAPSD